MKNLILLLTLILTCQTLFAAHYTHGYTRRNGTYVQGHMSDDPGEGRYGHWHDNQYYSNNDIHSHQRQENNEQFDNLHDDDGMLNNDQGDTTNNTDY